VKKSVKQLLRLLSILLMGPITAVYLLLNTFLKSDTLFSTFSQALSLIPGKMGCYLRAGFYRFTLTRCSQNVYITFLTLFSQRDSEIESGVYIGPQCNIGKCKIGKDVLLGSNVHIMSGKGQHNFTDLKVPIRDQGGTFEKIEIGEDTWIGNGALVMANVGRSCVVAAGSVVIEEVCDYAIVAGNPAKIIKMRT
jgi:acetyltransferase-like isoleucine patch superfamily enzyme